MMFVWRLRSKIIKTVLSCVVHSDMRTKVSRIIIYKVVARMYQCAHGVLRPDEWPLNWPLVCGCNTPRVH